MDEGHTALRKRLISDLAKATAESKKLIREIARKTAERIGARRRVVDAVRALSFEPRKPETRPATP